MSAADRDQPTDGDTPGTPIHPTGNQAAVGRERRLPRRPQRPSGSGQRSDAAPRERSTATGTTGGTTADESAAMPPETAGAGGSEPDRSDAGVEDQTHDGATPVPANDERPDDDRTSTGSPLSPAVRPPDNALATPDGPTLGPGGGRSRPPVGPVAILGAAALVLLVLLVIIVLGRDNGSKQETAPPCLQTDLPTALNDITDGRVTTIRVAAADNAPDRLAVAVELDLENGGCLALPQGADATEQRTAIVGAATIYNATTEQQRISIQIDRISLPPTETAVPTREPTATIAPTRAPTLTPTVASTAPPALVAPPAGPAATPGTPPSLATPARNRHVGHLRTDDRRFSATGTAARRLLKVANDRGSCASHSLLR